MITKSHATVTPGAGRGPGSCGFVVERTLSPPRGSARGFTWSRIRVRMARPCPWCEGESLRPLRVPPVEVETCPRCHGLWFGRGQWDRLPDRPRVRTFVGAASGAPSRCRKRGHRVPAERRVCPTCQGAPPGCPECGGRLARVATSACELDVCGRCEGVWLEAGCFERLAGVTHPQARPAGRVEAEGLRCADCATALRGREVFAHAGDVYCARCRPPSAVSRGAPSTPG
jgi:Zn-finger nucleic acid-binding protein